MLTPPLEALPEGSWYPEKGMDAKEGESADQQTGHGPERIEQKGILIPVMVCGMGEITGKFPVGTRMAFFAGLHHMAPVQAGLTVVGRQNIMGPVTVGTFSCLLTTGKH